MKKVLFLGAPIFQSPVIQTAKAMGLYVGAVDINKDAPAFCFADECFVCSIRDEQKVLDIAKKFNPDGIVIGACDTSVVTAAYVCQEMGLPGHPIDVAVNSTNKVKMLESFQLHNVPHPIFRVVKSGEFNSISTNLPYPVITKPIDSAGGRGICIVHNASELKDAVVFSSQAGLSGDILIEEYMRGPEVSVEVLVVNGTPYVLQITDKITSGEPNFYEIGHSQPSALPNNTKQIIKELASKAVLAVGLYNSPAHVEIIITDQGPKMVELGARLGSDCITTYLLNTSVSGINMAQSAIELALGDEPEVSHYSDSGICVGVRFIPTKEGTLKEINGLDSARASSNVIKLEITGKIGNRYTNATDDTGRLGYVVCKGNSTHEAIQQCQNVIEKIQFVWE